MAGFMAGFGSAFSQAYQSGVDFSRQQENDMFKLRYSDYINRRDQYEKDDKERAKQINAAKSIANMTGQPTESWGEFYNLLANGASFDDVYKMAQNTQAVVGPAVSKPTAQSGDNAPADPRDNLTTAAQGAVDSQMTSSGMKTPQNGGIFNPDGANQPASNPNQSPTGDTSNAQLLGPAAPQPNDSGGFLHNIFKRGQERSMNARNGRVDDRVAQAAGVTTQQMQATMNRASNVQGTPVPGFPDAQITWQPKGGASTKPNFATINNIGDAAYALTWANQYGSDQEKQYAQALYNQFSHLASDQAKNKGIEMGTYQEPTRAAILNPKTHKYDGGTAVLQPDGNGNMVWKDAQDNVVDEKNLYKYNQTMEKEISDISKTSGKSIEDYNKNLMDFTNLVRTSTDLNNLSQKYPEAMGISGDVSQMTDAWRRAGINIAKIVNPAVDQDGNIMIDPNSAMSQLEQAENKVMSQMKGPIDRNSQNALAATLMDIKATRIAYMWAAAAGAGTGRSISNRDFEAFKQAAKGGENPEGLAISSADFIKQQYQSLKDQEKMLNENSSQIKNFESKYRIPSPLKPAMSVDEALDSDQQLKSDFERFIDKSNNNALTNKPTQPVQSRPRAKNPKTGEVVEWDGKQWVPVQ